MRYVNINDIDLNESFYHFTCKDNLELIEQEGLKAKIGDSSKLKSEEKSRVYLSQGWKGLLSIKNSFVYEFKQLKICEIPEEYRKYFNMTDFSSTEKVKENDVYEAMEKRFKDEVYFIVDAVPGEDFDIEEYYDSGMERDIKGKADHDISPKKLSHIVTEKGDTAYDVVEYIIQKVKDNGFEDIVKDNNSDLYSLFDYVKNKEKEKNTFITGLKNGVYKEGENVKVNSKNIETEKIIEENNIEI